MNHSRESAAPVMYRLFSGIMYAVVGLLSGIILVFGIATVITFRQYEQNDLFDISRDNIPLLMLSVLIALAVMAGICRFFYKEGEQTSDRSYSNSRIDRTSQLNENKTTARTCGFFCDRLHQQERDHAPFPWAMILVSAAFSLFMVLVIRGNATNDALQLDEIMQEFSSGNYNSFQQGGYLFVYPFQVTYVLIGQVIAAAFGPSNYLVYQLLNVVSIVCNLYCLYRIAWELFHSQRICLVMELLSMGCWFYYVFATFIYSDLWSFAPQTAAFLFMICYLRRRKWSDILWAGIMIAAACLLKTNCYIALIAMVLTLLVDGILPKTENEDDADQGMIRLGRAVLTVILLLTLCQGSKWAVNKAVAKAAGLERLPEGTPAITYLAMGMQEAEGKYGWYNGRNVGLFREGEFDRERTTQLAIKSIQKSIAEFRNSGRYFVRFYLGKFLSQWGDPTCVSMRELEETNRHTEASPLEESLIFGSGSQVLQWGMNVIQTIIYLGVCIYLGSRLIGLLGREHKSPSLCEFLIVIFILGGMLFHQLWEASGRYTMRYYLTMLPLAAYGIDALSRHFPLLHCKKTDASKM